MINRYLVTIDGRTFVRSALPAVVLSDGHGWSGLAASAAFRAADPRDAAEKRLRDALVAMFEKTAPVVARKIANHEHVSDDELAEAWRGVMQPNLAQTATEEGLRLGAEVGVQFDPPVVNLAAADWAKRYTYDLVKDINATTMKDIARSIEEFVVTPGMTIGELTRSLTGPGAAFSPVRAEMQAVTETTRAFSAATRQYQARLAESGIRMQLVWRTVADARVCLLCLPLNGKPESEWTDTDGPPRHVSCRCSTTLRLPPKPKVERPAAPPVSSLSARGEMVSNWFKGVGAPWDATANDIASGRVPGFKYVSDARYEARNNVDGTISLGPHFFESDRVGRKLTVAHEVGHDVAGPFLSKDARMQVLESFRVDASKPRTLHSQYDNFMGASSRPEEMVSDVYAGLLHGADAQFEGKRYTRVFDAVREEASALGLPASKLFSVNE